MSIFSTPAILLRKIEYGDYDLIISFFTLSRGKISAIAKAAKKSKKRFAGILELFFLLEIVCHTGRSQGLPVLQEAVLKCPFLKIGTNVQKTAYASYWAEIINFWVEENKQQAQLFQLLQFALSELDLGRIPETDLSMLFQMRFLREAGLNPVLGQCMVCRKRLEHFDATPIEFDLNRGGLVCQNCATGSSGRIYLSKGTIKQLMWLENGDLAKAKRIRFSPTAQQEGIRFLEAFVPYHLGRDLKSLSFLHEMRNAKKKG